jgi:hypothetical protein
LGGVGHKAERQLVRHQTLDQTLGIREVSLPAVTPLIRLRLREMQRAGGRSCVPAAPAVPVASRVPTRPTPGASTAPSTP